MKVYSNLPVFNWNQSQTYTLPLAQSSPSYATQHNCFLQSRTDCWVKNRGSSNFKGERPNGYWESRRVKCHTNSDCWHWTYYPLVCDREIKDLTLFLIKALYGNINLNINNYVTFVEYGCTRLWVVLSFKLLCVELLLSNHLSLTS